MVLSGGGPRTASHPPASKEQGKNFNGDSTIRIVLLQDKKLRSGEFLCCSGGFSYLLDDQMLAMRYLKVIEK